MSANAWMTSDNLLMDLRGLNGGNPGAEHLEHYVVRGEGPPPVRQELPDDDEMQYRFCAAPGTSADADNTPDLKGIAQMLQMVNHCDDPEDSGEFKTIVRNTTTDEICISKLNPRVEEFVPGQNKTGLNRTQKLEHQTNLNKKGPVLIKKSGKKNISGGHFNENGHSPVNSKTGGTENNEISLGILNGNVATVASSSISNLPTGRVSKEPVPHCSTSTLSSSRALDDLGDISLRKKLDIDSMKIDDIIAVDEKVKSKIISSSQDNSLQSRKEKNVAIATLLKLRSAQKATCTETSVKLVTPAFFQSPPTPIDDVKKITIKDLDELNKEVIQTHESPSSSTENQYVDPLVQESICKVNDWFNSSGKPKQKPQVVAPAKQPMTIKKKITPNPSTSSTPSIEKKESCGNFVPSSYANDLLQKYESNARKQTASKEDLGTMLERQLKERDQLIKKKLLENKGTVSPGSGRSVQ